MGKKDELKRIAALVDPYRVTSGRDFLLKEIDPADTQRLSSEQKDDAKNMLEVGVRWLAELQDTLYAQDRWSVLLIFQAMDAAGKDGTIKHVMSGINPQGCQVFSFKQPSSLELDHDYMWRYMRCLPERGRIGIFNRSYYEEVLVVRVHEEILKCQKMPESCVTKNIWKERLDDIANFESYLARNGVLVLKFFLHVSKKEQKRRFMERLERPEKHWKFSMGDLNERGHWRQYMKFYEEAIRGTASKNAPWFVVPADNKWFTRLVVSAAIVEAMEKLDLSYPMVDDALKADIAAAKELLMNE